MHGIWFLVALPLAGVLAWRLGGRQLQRMAGWFSLLAAVGLCGWFGFLVFEGSEFTETLFDRVMHGIGVIVTMIDIPVVQFLTAAVVVMCWPVGWIYQAKPHVVTEQASDLSEPSKESA